MDKKLFYILATIFIMRSKYYAERKEHWAAVAYDDAFDMLAYAMRNNWDCLRQFGWSDEAEDLINAIGTDVDLWDLEEFIKATPPEDAPITKEIWDKYWKK